MRIHTTTVLVVDGCTLFSLVLVFGDKEGIWCIDDDHTTLPCPTTIQGVVGVVVYFLWFSFVYSYYVAQGDKFQAQSFREDL